MKERLKKLWKVLGGFDILDVDNGFYMVKCELLADSEKIFSEGPWILFDHYLVVSRWTRICIASHEGGEYPSLDKVSRSELCLL